MKIQFILVGVFTIILLVISPYGLGAPDHKIVLRDVVNDTSTVSQAEVTGSNNADETSPVEISTVTTAITSETRGADNATTQTNPTTTPVLTTVNETVTPTVPNTSTVTIPITSESISSSTAPTVSTTVTQPATTKAPGRKFDGPSFIGGMILVVGLGALVYLVIRYLRRGKPLPYSNLH